MPFTVRLPVRVAKRLDQLPREIRRKVVSKLESLEHNPRPVGAEKLSGSDSLYRIRAGDWRVIYAVQDQELVVLVIRIGHRKDVYRQRK
jgi:mRNA interferase RelE/StbE